MNDGWVEAEFEAILRERYVRVIGQVLAGLSQIWGGAAPVEGCRRPVKQAVHFNRVLGLS
jgi:hypothetical protein